MAQTMTLSIGVACASLIAGPLSADLSAADVWAKMQADAREAGGTLSADIVDSGTGLVLNNLRAVMSEEDGSGAVSIETWIMDNTADGTVTVTIPSDQAITFKGKSETEGTVSGQLLLTGEALTSIISGTIEQPSYDTRSAMFSGELQNLLSDGGAVPLTLSFAFKEFAVQSTGLWTGNDAPLSLDLTADELNYDFEASDATTGQSFANTTKQVDYSLKAEATPAENIEDWTVAANSLSGPGKSRVSQSDPSTGAFNYSVSHVGSATSVGMSDSNVNLSTSVDRATWEGTASQFPIGTVKIALANADIAVAIPIGLSDSIRAGNIVASINEMTISENVWSLFDPGKALPRTAANFLADLGFATSIVEPGPAQPGAPDIPFEVIPSSVKVNALSLDVLGASVSANGAFKFAPGTKLSDPNPRPPIGSLSVQANGALTLLQRLTTAGIVNAQEAMGAQMMIGMFATPGEGDSLSSKVEVTPDGRVMVNGTRVQ